MTSKLTLPYQIVDAFATGPFTGNQAGVLVLASALSDTLMQQIAALVYQQNIFG
jgi:predicted PhzF superfamily epimerase YddE/YHI9